MVVAELMRMYGKPGFGEMVRRVAERGIDRKAAKEIVFKGGIQDKALGQLLDSPDIVRDMGKSEAVRYVLGLRKVKVTQILPNTYQALETAILREKDVTLEEITGLFVHYSQFKVCPPREISDLLIAKLEEKLKLASFYDLTAFLKYVALFGPGLKLGEVEKMLEGVEGKWPEITGSSTQCKQMMSLAHSLAVLEIGDSWLWKRVLSALLTLHPYALRTIDIRIAALMLQKAYKFSAYFRPRAHSPNSELWSQVLSLYPFQPSFLHHGETSSKITTQVYELLHQTYPTMHKNGTIDTVFPYDILINTSKNLEIDGETHYIHSTIGENTGISLGHHSARDKYLATLGFQVLRLNYRRIRNGDIEKLKQKITEFVEN